LPFADVDASEARERPPDLTVTIAAEVWNVEGGCVDDENIPALVALGAETAWCEKQNQWRNQAFPRRSGDLPRAGPALGLKDEEFFLGMLRETFG